MMLVLAWPLIASAFAAEPPLMRERFGDFTYDAGTYAVEGGDQLYFVRRRSDPDGEGVLMATINEGPATDCTIAKLDAETSEGRDRHFQTLKRDGFEVHIVSWYQGCRNARPPLVAACTAYRGRVYRFHAYSIGCKGGPGFGARPDGFLGSLAVVP